MSLNLIDQAAQRKRIEEILSNVESAKTIESLLQQLAASETRLEEKTAECLSFYNEAETVIKQRDKAHQQLASRDAEVVSLTNQRDYEYVRAENAEQERDQFEQERDQLREQVTMLREALRDCAYDESGFCINPDAAEVLAAMEEKL